MEIARRLVASGDQVEWFTAAFPGAAAEEVDNGVRVVRRGRQWTVHQQAHRRYARRLKEDFDVVIDEVNTIPFFTPLWADVPVFMLIHQLAREVWWHETRFPLSAIGFALEPLYLRLYRKVPVITVSDSTRGDLLRLGFRGPISIVSEGIEPISIDSARKAPEPTFLYVGRLSPSKRVDHVIRAFADFQATYPTAQLWIVGEGPSRYRARLGRLAEDLHVADHVRFWGWLEAHVKHERMAAAHMLLVTSVREGWGLVVSEANACGTPAIVYDVGGLRDSVRHERTGLVTRPEPRALASGMRRLWEDPDLYRRLRATAESESHSLSFDRAATAVRELLMSRIAPGGALSESRPSNN